MVPTTRTASQSSTASNVTAALLANAGSRPTTRGQAAATPSPYTSYAALSPTDKRAVVRQLLRKCDGQFSCDKCNTKNGKLAFAQETPATVALVCGRAGCGQKYQGTALLRKLLEVVEAATAETGTESSVAIPPKAVIHSDKAAERAPQHTGSSEETPAPHATAQNTTGLEGSEADASSSPQGSITELEMLRKENDMLRAQLSSQTSLLHAQSGQISELTSQVRKLNEKIDGISSAQHNAQAHQSNPPAPAVATPEATSSGGEKLTVTVPAAKKPNPATNAVQPAALLTVTAAAGTQPPTPAQRPKLSWAEIARAPTANALPSGLQEKFVKSKATLAAKGFAPIAPRPRAPPNAATTIGPSLPSGPATPTPSPVYFGGVPRGPIGALKRALLECLPSWAVLSISFIGNSACEILCHRPLEQRLVAGMKLLGFRHLPSYNPLKAPTSDQRDATAKRIRVACYRRWKATASKTFSPTSKEWYTTQADAILASDTELRAQMESEDAQREAERQEKEKNRGSDHQATTQEAPQRTDLDSSGAMTETETSASTHPAVGPGGDDQ